MAAEVSRVAQRCEEAKQSLVLDLSHCELMSMPEAVFFILKDVQLHEVNLSHNKLKKLPKKFSSKFATITSESLTVFIFSTTYVMLRTNLNIMGVLLLCHKFLYESCLTVQLVVNT